MPQTQNRQPSEIDKLLVDYTSRRLDEEADRQGVPRDFVRRIAGAESSGRADVIRGRRRSSAGAIGKMQLMPGTAGDLGVDPYNVDENVEGGVRYLKRQLDSFGGDRAKAAAAYNAGAGNVRKYGGVPPFKETQDYVKKVAGPEQGGSEIDRLYADFAGRQETTPGPQYDERGRKKLGARDFGITPVEWPEGRTLRTSTGEFIEPSKRSRYAPPKSRADLEIMPGSRADLEITPRAAKPVKYPNPGTGDLVPPAPPRPLTPSDRKLAADEVRRRNAAPAIARMVSDFEALKREGSLDAARSVAAKIAMQYGDLMEVGEGDGWPYVKSKIRGWNPVQPAAGPSTPSLEEQRAAFSRRPMTEQVTDRALDAFARGGGQVSRMARQALGAGLGITQGAQTGDFSPVDLPEWRQGEEERFRALEERRQARPSSFATDVGEGIIEAVPSAAAAIGGTILTGGGLPAAMVIGGGMGAAGADWRDPKRAATQAALGAVAPVVGGKIGQSVAGRVASRMATPAAQATTRAVGEIGGGALGNVGASGAEQLTFEGRLDPRELARQAVIGGALSAPGAIRSLRRGASLSSLRPDTAVDRAAMEIRPTQPMPAVIPPRPGEAQTTRRLLPPAEAIRSRADLPIVARENAPTAELPTRAQIRATGPAVEEAAIRARLGLDDASPSGRAARAPESEIDALYDQFATQRGNAPAVDTAAPRRAPEPQRLPFDVAPARKIQHSRFGEVVEASDQSGVRQGHLRVISSEGKAHVIRNPRTSGNREASFVKGQEAPAETPAVVHRNPDIDRKPILAKTQDDRVIVPNPSNKSGVSIVKDRSGEPTEHKFSSTQADLPKDVAGKIGAFGRRIPDADLAEKGRETDPHVTVKYGLHGDDPEAVRQALEGEGPIKVKLGKTSLFESDKDYDVVKVDVDSPDLRRLNKKIADALPHTDTFPTYRPHATVAYVKKGLGKKYAGDASLEGETMTLDRITFSDRSGKRVEIPLSGQGGAQVAGEPVSPRWLNAQRRRGAELLGLDPDQIPTIDEAPEGVLQNLQTPQTQPAAPTRTKSGGQILGSGFGGLQSLFERAGGAKPPKASEPSPEGSRRGRVFETIGAAQTVSQLGSPGFVLRNVLQHASHGAQEMATQGVAGLIDKAVAPITGKRTVGGLRNPVEAAREVRRFFDDYKAGVQAAREAINRGDPLPGARLKDMPDPETLTAVGRRLSKVLTYINEVPDAGNWNAHFQRSMRDQARVFARSKPSADKSLQRVDQMIERAWAEADHASMRDPNFMSKTLIKLKESLNTLSSPITGTDKFGLGDFVVKYVQVPGALVKRGIEYSPLGIIESGYYAVKRDQRRAVQSLSRAVTGSTTGVGVGAALAALGILVGPEHDEGQIAGFEREEGRRGYSINMSALKRLAGGGWDDPESGKLQAGDQLAGIDWLQPWALQASAGAAVYNLYSKGKLGAGSGSLAAGKAVYDSMAKALDVMGDQSVLKNLGRYLGRATGATTNEKFVNFFKAIGLDVPSSFVPSLARLARQVADPYERDARPEDPEDFVGEATNRALANLPGVSQTFPARPSALTGKPKRTAVGGYSLPVRSLRMVSPAPFTSYEPQPIAREAARLTDAGYRVSFTPPKREKGERTSVLRRREEQFAETFAENAPQLIEHPYYQIADDETQAEALNDLAKLLRRHTRMTVPERTIDEIIDRAGDRVYNRRSRAK